MPQYTIYVNLFALDKIMKEIIQSFSVVNIFSLALNIIIKILN